MTTVRDMLPTANVAPNLNAKFTPGEPGTSAVFRRRLLAWAELLESKLVEDHWDYSTWGNYQSADVCLSSGRESMCGTVACAGGWLHLVPEAFENGAEPRGMWYGNHAVDADPMADFFGLSSKELSCITYAVPYLVSSGMPQLSLNCGNESSPKDVAKAVRWLADYKYPAPEPKKAKPIKPYTKRYWAKLYRDGAKFLESNPWGRGSFYSPYGGYYCAIGAASCAGGWEEKRNDSASIVGAKVWSDDLVTSPWNRPTLAVEKAVLTAMGFNATKYGLIDYNDMVAEGKEDVIEAMRTIAYYYDHGGKMPPKYGGPKYNRKARAK